MGHSKDDKDRISLDRRAFLRAGGLGAAALAAAAAGRAPVEAEAMPRQGGPGQAAQG